MLLMPFLKVPSLMQIGDMKQYLQSRLKLPETYFARLEILVNFDNNLVTLDECLTMSDVLMSYWDCQSDFVIYFRVADDE